MYSVDGVLVTYVQVSSVWRYVRNIFLNLHESVGSVVIQSMPCEDALRTVYYILYYIVSHHITLYEYVHISYPCNRQWGPIGLQTSSMPYFLDSRFTGGGKVVSLKRRPRFTPRNIHGTHFC
jgi:hypothetical protein